MVSFPGLPVYSVTVGVVGTIMISTIQVGAMTCAVPPCAMITDSAVTSIIFVIVAVFVENGRPLCSDKESPAVPVIRTSAVLLDYCSK